jgi:hypothetical protein
MRSSVRAVCPLHLEPCEHAFRITTERVEAPRATAEVDGRFPVLDCDHHGSRLLGQAGRADDDISDLREVSLRVGRERLPAALAAEEILAPRCKSGHPAKAIEFVHPTGKKVS